VLDFEKALGEHHDMHRAADDPRGWQAWQEIVGDDSGAHDVRTCCHTRADLDAEMDIAGDREHVLTALDPHIVSMSTSLTNWREDISRWPEDPTPPRMVEIVEYDLEPGAWADSYHAVKALHELIGDKELPHQHAWGDLVVGGGGAAMVLAIPRSSWSEFAPKTPRLWDVLEEVHGEHEEHRLREAITGSIVAASDRVLLDREDLSSVPGN
jgi:hypothetical protein